MPTIPELLSSPETFVTTLLAILDQHYGLPILLGTPDEPGWTLDTLLQEVSDDFHVVLPDHAVQKIRDGLLLLGSNDFSARLPSFIEICKTLNGAGEWAAPLWSPAHVQDCSWGVTEASLLAPPDHEETFAPEIRAYVRWMLRHEGYTSIPNCLQAIPGLPPLDNAELPTEHSQQTDEYVGLRLQDYFTQLHSLPGGSGLAARVLHERHEQ